MRGSILVLLFFLIIYNLIITYLLIWGYYEFKERIDNKDDYIEKLHFQLANKDKKWYFIVKEGLWKRY